MAKVNFSMPKPKKTSVSKKLGVSNVEKQPGKLGVTSMGLKNLNYQGGLYCNEDDGGQDEYC